MLHDKKKLFLTLIPSPVKKWFLRAWSSYVIGQTTNSEVWIEYGK